MKLLQLTQKHNKKMIKTTSNKHNKKLKIHQLSILKKEITQRLSLQALIRSTSNIQVPLTKANNFCQTIRRSSKIKVN
jgi:hypothetical protein